jgi:uncharacterized membrane protein YhaH (DUF805 family)
MASIVGLKGRARRKLFFPLAAVSNLLLYDWAGSYMLTKRTVIGSVDPTALSALPLLWLALGGIALWVLLSMTVRRLHDTGHSGKWVLLSLLPGASILMLLALSMMPGEDGENVYGPDPRAAGRLLAIPSKLK